MLTLLNFQGHEYPLELMQKLCSVFIIFNIKFAVSVIYIIIILVLSCDLISIILSKHYGVKMPYLLF